jgi:hypothetical protein
VTGAEIIALVTGLPAVISAVTALVIAVRGQQAITAHVAASGTSVHDARPGWMK